MYEGGVQNRQIGRGHGHLNVRHRDVALVVELKLPVFLAAGLLLLQETFSQ
jgi:hypothetical protein